VPTSQVCIGQNLTVNSAGQLQMAPWSVPNVLYDVIVPSVGDGTINELQNAPGQQMMSQQLSWTNPWPVDCGILIRVVRRYKQWVTSNPNAIEFNDRWTWQINGPTQQPTTVGLYNGLCGSAEDVGTNDVAMPNPGVFYHWWGTTTTDEWVWETVQGTQDSVNAPGSGDTFNFWYQAYVWTPPPWSDNANLNSPEFAVSMGYSRVQLIAFPQQGALVKG
jgi:hypothetical protein